METVVRISLHAAQELLEVKADSNFGTFVNFD